jgi:hypothetical protein
MAALSVTHNHNNLWIYFKNQNEQKAMGMGHWVRDANTAREFGGIDQVPFKHKMEKNQSQLAHKLRITVEDGVSIGDVAMRSKLLDARNPLD